MILQRQLALPFPHAPHYDAEDFCAAPSNEAALTWLARTAEWPGGRLAVWGEEGSGKTHLLHLWTRRTGAHRIEGATLRGVPRLPPRNGTAGGLAIDDADAASDEPALLHLMNAMAEAGRPLLLAGRTPPARWRVRLPDLASRLRALTAVGLRPPEDDLLRTLLARLLSDRQLTIAEPLQSWLLLHLPRRPAALREAVARLDRAALAAGGRVGRPLAAAVVAELADEPAPGGADDGATDDVFASQGATASPSAPALI